MSSTFSDSTATGSPFTGRLSVLSDPPQPIFTYGTLMFAEILDALLGRVPESRPAVVDGWRAVAIPGVSYPALIPGPGQVRGRVLLDVRRDEWPILDAYEDAAMYDLRPIVTTPGGEAALAYVCRMPDRVSDVDWDGERFAAEELADFAPRCASWREGLFPTAESAAVLGRPPAPAGAGDDQVAALTV